MGNTSCIQFIVSLQRFIRPGKRILVGDAQHLKSNSFPGLSDHICHGTTQPADNGVFFYRQYGTCPVDGGKHRLGVKWLDRGHVQNSRFNPGG